MLRNVRSTGLRASEMLQRASVRSRGPCSCGNGSCRDHSSARSVRHGHHRTASTTRHRAADYFRAINAARASLVHACAEDLIPVSTPGLSAAVVEWEKVQMKRKLITLAVASVVSILALASAPATFARSNASCSVSAACCDMGCCADGSCSMPQCPSCKTR
jgi:hypothetical protein